MLASYGHTESNFFCCRSGGAKYKKIIACVLDEYDKDNNTDAIRMQYNRGRKSVSLRTFHVFTVRISLYAS